MIGQRGLIEKINTMIDSFPRFSIVVGAKGSGKHDIVKYICNKLHLNIVEFGTGIDEVRKIIELSYEQDKPTCYFCPNADSMSLGAKNALLKITEEPPKNSYFILTLISLSNTLETIQSRATVLPLDVYSNEDLVGYRKYRNYSDKFDYVIKDVCETTGDVDELFSHDVPSFYKFAETVAFQISIPTTGNIFKIPKNLKLTDKSDGYDPTLLFKTVRNLYIKKAIETKEHKYLYASNVTSDCLKDLNLPTVVKMGTIDKWIMDVRRVLR